MSWLSWVGMAASGYNAYSQYQSGKQAEDIANMNASNMRRETEEEARRLERQQKMNQASMRARAAASGIKLDGSSALYIDEQKKEDKRQLDWMKEAGENRALLTQVEGSYNRRNAEYSSYGTLLSGIATWW